MEIAIQVPHDSPELVAEIEAALHPHAQRYELTAFSGESSIITFLIVVIPSIATVIARVMSERIKASVELGKVRVLIDGQYVDGPADRVVPMVERMLERESANHAAALQRPGSLGAEGSPELGGGDAGTDCESASNG